MCVTLSYFFRHSAELISQPTNAQKFATPVKRATSRKRIMSIIGGMPYRKMYAANGKDKPFLSFRVPRNNNDNNIDGNIARV